MYVSFILGKYLGLPSSFHKNGEKNVLCVIKCIDIKNITKNSKMKEISDIKTDAVFFTKGSTNLSQ